MLSMGKGLKKNSSHNSILLPPPLPDLKNLIKWKKKKVFKIWSFIHSFAFIASFIEKGNLKKYLLLLSELIIDFKKVNSKNKTRI